MRFTNRRNKREISKNMSRTRDARKGHETRRNFSRSFGDFAAALAAKETKFSIEQTKAMVIIRTANGEIFGEPITFGQAYGELFAWEGKRTINAFSNISEDGLSDMLAATFFQGALVCTAKADYFLWNKTDSEICDLCGQPSADGEIHNECAYVENHWDELQSEDDDYREWSELRYEEMEMAA